MTIKEKIKEIVLNNTNLTEDEYFDEKESYIKGLDTLTNAILSIPKTEIISIVGDYDCDGVTSTAILANVLKRAGWNVEYYIPKRFSDGYGINTLILNRLSGNYIITIDNGIAAIDAVKEAKKRGKTVYILDHHQGVRDDGILQLPEADIIVDPNAEIKEESEFKDFCAAGLALRLSQKMFPAMDFTAEKVLAGIGTVADVVSITKDNRNIVKEALEIIKSGNASDSINTLIKMHNIKNIDTDTFGYTFGPMFNAPGRLMDNGGQAVVDFLLADNKEDIMRGAMLLGTQNEIRKKESRTGYKFISNNLDKEDKPYVYFHPGLKEGIIGIIAGELCEKNMCPVIIFTSSEEDGFIKGSGRSVQGINIKAVLDEINKVVKIEKYGGHAGACGLSLSEEKLNDFTKMFKDLVSKEKTSIKEDSSYDLLCPSNPEEINELYEAIQAYAPYGEGNPEPTVLYNGEYTEHKMIGKDKTTVSIKTPVIDMIGFGFEDCEDAFMFDKILATGNIKKEIFNGSEKYKLFLKNIE